MPLPFSESQGRFEQRELGIAQAFSGLAAMLADFLLLQGTSNPRVYILSFQVFQLQEVFRQHSFPHRKCIHLCFPLINE